MFRSLTSLATAWTAYRLLRLDERLPHMDSATAKKWAACIPSWEKNLPDLHSGNWPWLQTIYRHGHKINQDPEFWKRLQHAVTVFSNRDLDSAMLQAGLFKNPMPFLHFEPYIDKEKNILGETQIVTGMVQYMRTTFKHGTHPLLGRELTELGMTLGSCDWGLFNLPIRSKDTLFQTREDNSENYWRFFSGEKDFPIDCLVDYYKSMLALNPSETAYASWAHAAWDARRTNKALQPGAHWEEFERQIRPLYNTKIDWELIAACHGFVLSADNSRNGEIAAYAQNQLMPHSPIAHPIKTDPVAVAMLELRAATCPWDIYTLFAKAPNPDTPIESYSFDFR